MEEGSNHMEGEKGMNQSQGGEEEKEPITWRGSREGTDLMEGEQRRNQSHARREEKKPTILYESDLHLPLATVWYVGQFFY